MTESENTTKETEPIRDAAGAGPQGQARPSLRVGAAYYPEHWPRERWPEDIRLMGEAGLTVVRMGEFAWSSMEPAPGEFQMEWLEDAITLLADAGIDTVLGTPTAAPPAWLIGEHPEVLAVDEEGQRVSFGNRCHYCVNAPTFHEAVESIVSAMAQRFGSNEHVIGWQIDNEFNRVCTCDECRRRFQRYLEREYGMLDNLNERWSTAYWSQTYSSWDQIPIPIGPHNPGLRLAFKRFVTESYRQFQKLQIDLLRPHLPDDVWITHNFMGWYGGYDHYTLAQDLDIASWDWYVGSGHHDRFRSGAYHDLVRGLKGRSFWLMETQPGHVNWSGINNALDRGEGRAMAWEAVAHGADAVLYWQWRPALGGQEQLHGSLIDQAGQPRPFYGEAQQIADEFARVKPLLDGEEPKARVAILNCYESRWSLGWQPHHHEFDYVEHLIHYYQPIANKNIPVDVIGPDAPLDGYRLLVIPALTILDEERAERIVDWCGHSRYLVIGPRTAVKDRHNALLPSRPPGALAEMAGVEVEEFYALKQPIGVQGNWFSGVSRFWAERLHVVNDSVTAIAARFGKANGWLYNEPAITVNAHQGALVYYVAAYLDEVAQQAFMDRLLQTAGIGAGIETPTGVEARLWKRVKNLEATLLINHTNAPRTVELPWSAYDFLTEETIAGTLELEPYGIAVLVRPK